jgi:Ca2+-binding RTX toxin-like protein
MEAIRARRLTIVALVAVLAATACRASWAADDPPEREPRRCLGRRPTIVASTDTVRGTPGNDVILLRWGRQRVHALAGDDLVCGPGRDRVSGGRGDDQLVERGRNGHLRGGPGDDVLNVPWGDMRGGPGDDQLTCSVGHARGGGGDDLVYLRRFCYVLEGPGDDVNRGKDRDGPFAHREQFVDYRNAPRAIRVDLARQRASGWGHDTLVNVTDVVGTRFDDVLRGDDRKNRLFSNAGDDLLAGRDGDDGLEADAYEGKGADIVRGGHGDDSLIASGYFVERDLSNELFGGPGDDFLVSAGGDDVFHGGRGQDLADFEIDRAMHVDLEEGSATGWGDDRLVDVEDVLTGEGDDVVFGSESANTIGTEDGNDVVDGRGGDDEFGLGDGDDVVDGGWGADTLWHSYGARTIDLQAGTSDGENDHDTLVSMENVVGSLDNDVIWGDDGDNVISSWRGDDEVHGRAGDDTLDGGEGADALDGGDGTDVCSNGEILLLCEGPPGRPALAATFSALARLGLLARAEYPYFASARPLRPGYSRPPNGNRAERRHASSFAKRSR